MSEKHSQISSRHVSLWCFLCNPHRTAQSPVEIYCLQVPTGYILTPPGYPLLNSGISYKSSKMIGNFPAILNFNRFFLKLSQFICNQLPVLPDHRSEVLKPRHNIVHFDWWWNGTGQFRVWLNLTGALCIKFLKRTFSPLQGMWTFLIGHR